jgi:hypothetical protein
LFKIDYICGYEVNKNFNMAVKTNKVGKRGKQNRNAGNHPSYKKRKMTAEQIRKKRLRDKKNNAKPENKKKRAKTNGARKKLGLKIGDKRDASHTKNGIVAKHRSVNRGSRSDQAGDKRARGKGVTKKQPKRNKSSYKKKK